MNRPLVVIWTISRVAIAVLFLGWAALHLLVFDRAFGVSLPGWSKLVGIALVLLGGLTVLLCGGMLSTPGIVPTEFVVRGFFRYVRNPMSLAAVTMMVGLALFCRSLSILLFSALVFLLLHLFVVFVEEPGLETRFGDSYREYKLSVNRWFPALRAK